MDDKCIVEAQHNTAQPRKIETVITWHTIVRLYKQIYIYTQNERVYIYDFIITLVFEFPALGRWELICCMEVCIDYLIRIRHFVGARVYVLDVWTETLRDFETLKTLPKGLCIIVYLIPASFTSSFSQDGQTIKLLFFPGRSTQQEGVTRYSTEHGWSCRLK